MNPYGDSWQRYYDSGFQPVWLPLSRKEPPPAGWTGKNGKRQEQNVLAGKPAGNIALRLEGLVGIDIDAYKEAGKQTYDTLVKRNGPLPTTWRSSAREDGISGIYVYRCAKDILWASTLGPGIETVWRNHRYMVAPPSMHPNGQRYRWWIGDKEAGGPPPEVGSLPYIPVSWITTSSETNLTDQQEAAQLSGDEMCEFLERKLQDSIELLLNTGGSRHDAMVMRVLDLARAGCQHSGGRIALDTFKQIWIDFIGDERHSETAAHEYDRALRRGLAQLGDIEWECHLCGKITSVADKVHVPLSPLELLWREYPNVYEVARQQNVAPLALLKAMLAFVAAGVHPRIVLPGPPYPSPLNYFVVVVGGSGLGKSSLTRVASKLVPIDMPYCSRLSIGSGEGMLQAFLHKEKRNAPLTRNSVRGVLLTASEADQLLAIAGRSGSTLKSMLKQAWSSEHIGTANADLDRSRQLNEFDYAVSLIALATTDIAHAILSDIDNGFGQRFMVADGTLHQSIEEYTQDVPSMLDWNDFSLNDQAKVHKEQGTFLRLDISEEVRHIVWERRAESLADATLETLSTIDGHKTLLQLRTAALLMMLKTNGSSRHVSKAYWDMAQVLIDDRSSIVARVMEIGTRQRLKAKAHVAEEKAIVEISTLVNGAKRGMLSFLSRNPEGITKKVLKRQCNSRYSKGREEAFQSLIEEGTIVERDGLYYLS